MNSEKFNALPLIGILRGIEEKHLKPLVDIAIDVGLEALEITMNTDGAGDLIAALAELAGDNLSVGAGTVCNTRDLNNALDAGASFIVTPVLVDSVSRSCRENNIPLFPGALTPKEVFDAWEAGAEMVKLFPASTFGPKYIKELRGPFKDIKILACGGVNKETATDYFMAGANGAAFGGSIFSLDRFEREEYDAIKLSLQELIAPVRLAVGP